MKKLIQHHFNRLPPGYSTFLREIKTRIRASQVRASLAANAELIRLYWDIGQRVTLKQECEGWGSKIIDHLGIDVQRAFPGIEGFSRSNIHRMRAFYQAWMKVEPIVAQVARQLTTPIHNQHSRESGKQILSQPARQLAGMGPPQLVMELPWFHNVVLVEQVKDPIERFWYAHKAIEHGWSRSILEHQIESGLFQRQGKAITNFKTVLPSPQSDLAQQVLKDPYIFDFLTLRDNANERALERNLMVHVEKFLLELGAGFALVGRQVHLEIGGNDFYIDLLFYHLKLRCYVVIDLKARSFAPEYAGKMNFYLSAVDDLLRQPGDQPSIGLILCKSKQKIIAEYALRDIQKAVGISGYVTRLVESLPKLLQGAVPSIAEIEAELKRDLTPAAIRKMKTRAAKQQAKRRTK